jgi:hypothetical protein
VFDLVNAADFSDSTVNYGEDPTTQQFGWQKVVDPSTPLYQAETAVGISYPVTNTNVRTVY